MYKNVKVVYERVFPRGSTISLSKISTSKPLVEFSANYLIQSFCKMCTAQLINGKYAACHGQTQDYMSTNYVNSRYFRALYVRYYSAYLLRIFRAKERSVVFSRGRSLLWSAILNEQFTNMGIMTKYGSYSREQLFWRCCGEGSTW